MIQMTLQDLAEKVDTMRRLQRTYYQTRRPDILQTCKKLEREMDSLCQAILNTRPAEPTLFEMEASK